MVRVEPAAAESLAAMRARKRFGIAIAAMIRMMATTINNSMSEKPLCFRMECSSPRDFAGANPEGHKIPGDTNTSRMRRTKPRGSRLRSQSGKPLCFQLDTVPCPDIDIVEASPSDVNLHAFDKLCHFATKRFCRPDLARKRKEEQRSCLRCSRLVPSPRYFARLLTSSPSATGPGKRRSWRLP